MTECPRTGVPPVPAGVPPAPPVPPVPPVPPGPRKEIRGHPGTPDPECPRISFPEEPPPLFFPVRRGLRFFSQKLDPEHVWPEGGLWPEAGGSGGRLAGRVVDKHKSWEDG